MLSKYSFHPVLIWLMAVAGVNAGINAAILSPRQKTTGLSSRNSATPSLEQSIGALLPTTSIVSSATNQATKTADATNSSSTAPNTLGGVSESPDNATTSSNANHRSCHRTLAEYKTEGQGPFCEPKNLQDVWAGRTYSAIWDPDLYGYGANVTVFLAYTTPFGGMDSDYIWHKSVPNSDGEVEIELSPDWLQDQSRNNLTLSLRVVDRDGLRDNSGPIISLMTMPTPSTSSSATSSAVASTKHSDHSKLGVEVGIPIALVFFAAICIGLFLIFRRRKRGYLGSGRSRSQRMKGHGDHKFTGDDLRTTTRSRQDSFKDDPVQGGVELQPRVGHRREDSMG